METLLAALFAVLAALSNATGTVLQRFTAKDVAESGSLGLRLMRTLVHRPLWFGGVAAVVLAGALQALALTLGSLSLVQPLFVVELPFAFLIAAAVFGHPLPPRSLPAALAIAGGIAVALLAAAPAPGQGHPALLAWLLTLGAAAGAMTVCAGIAMRRPRGKARAALFAAAAAIGYAITAALLKTAADTFSTDGFFAFLTRWQTYGFAVSGVCAVLLLTQAMESGSLLASQPTLTLGDATLGLLLGTVLYDERIRLGWWLLPEVLGILLVAAGVLILSRAPVPSPTPAASTPAATSPSR